MAFERFQAKLDALDQRLDQERHERREEAIRGTARQMIQLLRARGHVVALDGDTVRVSPRPDPEIIPALVSMKPILVSILKQAL
jgi:hypothetical protein